MGCHYIRYLYIVYKFYVDLLYNQFTLVSYTKTRIKNMNTKYAIMIAIVAIAIILGSVARTFIFPDPQLQLNQ